jgi:VCBS repeat protein
MNYLDLYSSYPDRNIAAAWDSQVKEADKNPWLNEALRRCGDELFARFAACYADLRVLPRGARRSLQRRLARSRNFATALPKRLRQDGHRLPHRMAWSLAGASLLLALGQGVGTAATITVTTSNPNIASDGQCSLIEAIINANNDAPIFPDCAAGSGADTIVLPANANLVLSAVNNTDFGPTGLPVITSRITIEGNGATIARQGNAPAFGLMAVGFSAELTLRRVTLTGGSSSGNSGGISNSGTLKIDNSTISGNTADFAGGGLNNQGSLTIENSTISGNASNRGGGIYNFYTGNLTISNSTISGNVGGGLFNSHGVYGYCEFFGPCAGTLTLNNSLIAGNQSAEVENTTSSINVNNFNLFGSNSNAGVSGFTPGPTDIVPSVPLAQILGPLQNNGGPTQTHALVAGSPAIDAGNPNGCLDSQGVLLSRDQRRFRRNVDGNNDGTARCDIGAVEFGATPIAAPVDFDGDGKTDVAVYRSNIGNWFAIASSTGSFVPALNFGGTDFLPVPGDYDGDGKADVAVYQQSTGNWFVVGSTSGFFTPALNFGGKGFIPVPADYDGDGKTDVAVYESSTGNWFIVQSGGGFRTVASFGGPGYVPVPGDYDGDGRIDPAVYQTGQASTANWFVVGSTSGFFTPALNFGGTGFIPVPGDYDGDGKMDPAVYQSSTGNWFVVGSTSGFFTPALNFGGAEFEPVQGDYDGDGQTDVAVYQSSTGNWFVVGSSAGFFVPALNFGGSGFVPVLPEVTIWRAWGCAGCWDY